MKLKRRGDLISIINFVFLAVFFSLPTYTIIKAFQFPYQEDLLIRGDKDKYDFSKLEEEALEEITEEETDVAGEQIEVAEEPVVEVPVETSVNWWEYPASIKETTKGGDDLLVLVNKGYQLPSTYIPGGLTSVDAAGIRVTKSGLLVRSIILDDLKALGEAADADGIDLSILSTYRSYATQSSTYQYWVNYNGGDVAAADTVSARPGHSQHQLGTAVDFGSSENGDKVGSTFDTTDASQWLADNAHKYGFIISYPQGHESTTGYSYESWHYRYVGKDNALEMINSGKILESWLVSKN